MSKQVYIGALFVTDCNAWDLKTLFWHLHTHTNTNVEFFQISTFIWMKDKKYIRFPDICIGEVAREVDGSDVKNVKMPRLYEYCASHRRSK